MIIDLPDTTVSKISRSLVNVREEGGAVALGRVLTLVIVTDHGAEEGVIEAANDASREHPMRVIVLMLGDESAEPRLDAQIRVGGDAGASEVILLHAHGAAGSNAESLVTGLLLPDAPVVAWWTGDAPGSPSTSSLGRIAQRRITDAHSQPDPIAWVKHLGDHYVPGDTDLEWTRTTRWREQIAAILDQPPYETITAVDVRGASDSPATAILASWLRMQLDVPVTWGYLTPDEWRSGIKSVRLERPSGPTVLERVTPDTATLTQPDQPAHELAFPLRTLRECLAEELRILDVDALYGRVVTIGCRLVSPPDSLPHG